MTVVGADVDDGVGERAESATARTEMTPPPLSSNT